VADAVIKAGDRKGSSCCWRGIWPEALNGFARYGSIRAMKPSGSRSGPPALKKTHKMMNIFGKEIIISGPFRSEI
jgi:hypothetical protein